MSDQVTPRRTGPVRAAVRIAALTGLVTLLSCLPAQASATPGTGARTGTVNVGVVVAGSAATTVRADAVVRRVPKAQWRRIVAVGAWRPGCPVRRAGLRRVEVNHLGFDGQVHRGVLVVNRDVARSVAGIFTRLFDKRFPIRQIRPIEDFRGNDNRSMRADNTSAYNCRRAGQANASAAASPHANGRAIDVNPWENPWIDPRCDCWRPSAAYGTTRVGPGVIVKRGTAWRIFHRAGWIWQNSRTMDYQHFDTGYPSRRRTLP